MAPVTIAKDVMEIKVSRQLLNQFVVEQMAPKISFMGIPTPNIFAGGENMHGRFEYVSLQTMERAVDTIIGIDLIKTKKTEVSSASSPLYSFG